MGETFDVVVVGFGLAGAITAIEAHDAGATVLLVEKEPNPGGISICAGGGVRIADDAAKAFAYLKATNAGTTPSPS
jgi:succinate dehydrogenase/fumarate reductase flavoprotein subunit